MKPPAALLGMALTGAALAGNAAQHDWPKRDGKQNPAQLTELFPESAAMLRQHIAGQVEAGNREAAIVALRRLADMGYALSARSQEQLSALINAELASQIAANSQDRGETTTDARIPASNGLVESSVSLGLLRVASGVTAQDLLVSKVGQVWRRFDLTGLGSLTGLVADPRRQLIWASAGVFEQTPKPRAVFSGIVAVDPKRGKVVRRIAAPPGVIPSDLTLGPDGTIYVSDPIGGGVWRSDPAAKTLKPLVPAGLLRSPQGLTLSADGGRLYVSDYRYGLAWIDLPGGMVHRLAGSRTMMLDGIDGLLRNGNELIAIQNGTRPMRIVAIRLSQDGRRAIALRILWQRLPGEGEPTAGEIRGRRLRFVANARWDLYGKSGSLPEGTGHADTEVHSLEISRK